MMAGLPGTGIGGMFYVGLTLAMPFRELYRAVRGKSNAQRWSFIAVQLGFVVAIAAGMWGEAWALGKLIEWCATLDWLGAGWQESMTRARMMSYVIPGGALICLASVVALFFGLKLVVKLGEKSRKVAPTAPADAQREAA
jgi:hypothetical protein